MLVLVVVMMLLLAVVLVLMLVLAFPTRGPQISMPVLALMLVLVLMAAFVLALMDVGGVMQVNLVLPGTECFMTVSHDASAEPGPE